MDNLFLNALSETETQELITLKENKDFAFKLLDNIKSAYHVPLVEVKDENHCSVCMFSPNSSRSNYGMSRGAKFVSNIHGVFFKIQILGYRKLPSSSTIKSFGELYEKYKSISGTKADASFLKDSPQPHGHVDFVIPIDKNNPNDAIRDIMIILKFEGFVLKK